jgi:predicted RecB family nuclease
VTVSSAEVADHVACRHKLALGRTAHRPDAAAPAPAETAVHGYGDPTHHLIMLVDAALQSAEEGRQPPAVVELRSASGQIRPVPVRDAEAFVRRARRRAEAFVADPHPTTSRPCDHCAHCPWQRRCQDEWNERDDLSVVAGAFGGVVDQLAAQGLDSVTRLAEAPPDPPPGVDARRYRTLRRQARLQIAARSGPDRYEILPPDEHPGGGFTLLPPPDPGDLFFDLEGDPYRGNGGLEYLWGVSDVSDRYRSWWGHTPADERAAFEVVVDTLTDHLDALPDAHVFHYASYEVDVLRRLALRYASREDQVERLSGDRRMVDLYRVVRQTVATSRPGYGMKQLEHFYRQGRGTEVQDGLASVVAYEAWLSGNDAALLDDIEAYNRDDCTSTRQLRDWLEDRRVESIARFGPGEASDFAPSDPPIQPPPRSSRAVSLARVLRTGLPDALDQRDETQDRDDLLLQLLEWHRREARRPPRPAPLDEIGRPSEPPPPSGAESLIATVEAVTDAEPEGRAFDRFLRRTPPTPPGVLDARDGETTADTAVRVGRTLDHGYLAIQGPPGTELSATVARLAGALTADGRRVGICGEDLDADPAIQRVLQTNPAIVAGPVPTFAAPAMRGALDVLVVIGAGATSLADLASMALSASSLVLCGDPAGVDRPQVRGRHPAALRRSVLSHLLDDDGTIPPDRGVLLDRATGIHPDIVRFISGLAYDGRLQPGAPPDDARPPDHESGLRWVPVDHQDRTTASPEEVEAVAALVETLVPDGAYQDVLVIAPFGDQVRLLAEALPEGCRVSTVEQAQAGGRAPIVVLSLTASGPEGIPGGRNRIFSRHRLTAALSRASDLAVIVANPQLLEARCRTPRQLAQLNSLIRCAEAARTMPVLRPTSPAPTT